MAAFGQCCNDLSTAMNSEFDSTFHVNEYGILMLAVGSIMTEQGPGWFDQAVMNCPFCGVELQVKATIQGKFN